MGPARLVLAWASLLAGLCRMVRSAWRKVGTQPMLAAVRMSFQTLGRKAGHSNFGSDSAMDSLGRVGQVTEFPNLKFTHLENGINSHYQETWDFNPLRDHRQVPAPSGFPSPPSVRQREWNRDSLRVPSSDFFYSKYLTRTGFEELKTPRQ